MATLRKIDAPIQYDPTYGSVIKIDAPITYDPVETMRVMTAPLSGPAPVPDLIDTGIIIGREIVPALVGAFIGSLAGPKGTIAGGAAGSALGNLWSQNYRIERGFQEDLGMAELGAATVLGGIPSATGEKHSRTLAELLGPEFVRQKVRVWQPENYLHEHTETKDSPDKRGNRNHRFVWWNIRRWAWCVRGKVVE